jgi:ElaB/YqjD/DUF883 family membrane-anchored ribosome-binding protein
MDAENTTQSAEEIGRSTFERGQEAAQKGYETAREGLTKGAEITLSMADDLRQFIRRQPWVALTAAFAIGYLFARITKRFSS